MSPVVPTVSRPTKARLKGDLNRLDRETDMLLATVDSLSSDELVAASRCEGWSRAHVVTHLARNADALGNLVEWAVTGVETPAYPSREARDGDIEAGAGRAADEIKADLRESCHRLRASLERLHDGVSVDTLEMPAGPVGVHDIPVRRTTEVVLHHADLDTVWGLEEADPEATFDALEDCLRRRGDDALVPGLTVKTHEGDEWTLGDGATTVVGDRSGVTMWLARGDESGVRADGELPSLPELG